LTTFSIVAILWAGCPRQSFCKPVANIQM